MMAEGIQQNSGKFQYCTDGVWEIEGLTKNMIDRPIRKLVYKLLEKMS
jgi:hypothetical protein